MRKKKTDDKLLAAVENLTLAVNRLTETQVDEDDIEHSGSEVLDMFDEIYSTRIHPSTRLFIDSLYEYYETNGFLTARQYVSLVQNHKKQCIDGKYFTPQKRS